MRSLHALARAAGLDTEYTNFSGKLTQTSDESLVSMLRSLAPDLGVHFETVEDAPAAMDAFEHARWAEIVPPTIVSFGDTLEIPFSVVADQDSDWEVIVTLESGRVVRAAGRMFDLAAGTHTRLRGDVRCIRRATVPIGEHGYHQVVWNAALTGGEALGICAPEQAWGAPGEGSRRWGVFAPVFGLASAETGQAGDLGTMRQLFDQVAARGGSYVATLPVLAQFLDEPCAFSPYSPASRIAWNEMYLELAPLAAEVGMAAPTAPPVVASEIDYREQYRWRRQALDPIARALAVHPVHGPAIEAWAAETGAYDYAAFRAIGETLRRGWHDWPAPYRDHLPRITDHAAAVAAQIDGDRVVTHVVAQWAMQRQLDALAAHPVGMYLDLPVGVNADAYEVWRHRTQFVLGASAGAPPDPLFTGGQDWGLPPLSPIALRRDHYRYFIRCVQHHMRVARMLRIDHVMGLFRLYCVPRGMTAKDGVYLRYPAEELLAILCLESHRCQCAIVGEDLGTVPEGVRPAMIRHGLFRLHVGQWFFPQKIGADPEPAPANSVASLNTHDTPTFGGWWTGADTDDRIALGLITDKQAAEERAERKRTKAALLAHAAKHIGDIQLSDEERGMLGATFDLVQGPAEVALITLDDLALEPQPHNVPGTSTERPNWQRRIPGWETALTEDRATPIAAATVAAVVAARTPRGSRSDA